MQEIDFWTKKERAIHHIYDQKESAPIGTLAAPTLRAVSCAELS
jgi:hypothetical protein